jgi:hypothetical protein
MIHPWKSASVMPAAASVVSLMGSGAVSAMMRCILCDARRMTNRCGSHGCHGGSGAAPRNV